MKPAEIREQGDEALVELKKDLARKLWKSRFNNFTNQLDDTDSLRRSRRDLARINTIMTERANGKNVGAAKGGAAAGAPKAKKAPKAAPVAKAAKAAAAPEAAEKTTKKTAAKKPAAKKTATK